MRDYLRGMSKEEFAKAMNDCVDKMEGLNDKDWEEIISDYNMDISRDCLRKSFTAPLGGYAIYRYMNELNSSDDEKLNEIEDKIHELEKIQLKVRTEKLELNKYKRIDTRNEMLYDEFKRSVKNTEVPNFKPLIINRGNKVAQLGISDFHFGKCFEILGNSYNEKIFYERMNKLASETIEICRDLGISKLHVLNCGDDIEGMSLRISQLKSLQYGFTDQVIKLAKYMVKFLNRLSEELEVTYHHVLEGNHSEIRSFGDRTWKE